MTLQTFYITLGRNTWFSAVLASLLCCSATSAQEGNPTPFSPAVDAPVVVYHDAQVLHEAGSHFVPHTSVVVRGDRIESILPAADLPASLAQTAEVVDLKGKYLIPGLIDAHVHLATPPDDLRALEVMRRQVYHGVTGIRIMADDLRPITNYARAAAMGEIAAPDIYSAALFAGPDFFNDPRVLAANQGITPGTAPWMQAITPDTDLTLAIAKAKGSGAMAIKLYDNLTPDRVNAITEAAHQQDMSVWAHGMVFPTEPKEVVAAGVDVISHTCYLGYQASEIKPQTYKNRFPVNADALINGDNPEMAEIFDGMARQKISLDATLSVYAMYDDRLAENPQMQPKPHCSLAVAAALTEQALGAGVTVVAGTDIIKPAGEAFPALLDELILLSTQTSMSNVQVLQAATSNGAAMLRQQEHLGSLTAGKLANMLILNSDPLADIRNLKDQFATIKRGYIFHPQHMPPLTFKD